MSEIPTLPQPDLILKDLDYMTRRWSELEAPARLEVRAFREGYQPQIAKFNPDDLQEAVGWIEDMNERGYSIYAVRNPVRADLSGPATDGDIIAAFFLWADCDDPTAAGNVLRFDGPKWSAAVITGTVPSQRAHTYWELQTACTDMAAWRQMQETIAAHFGSDRAVVNPSRIMRVGGTVTYPAEHKVKKGYVKEVTSIRTEYDDARPRVTLEQMARVFGDRTPAAKPTEGFHIATGEYDRKTADHYADILRRARTDGEKHTGVRDLAASLAGSGVPRALAEAMIREACPVWDDGVEDLIETAYAKFKPNTPEPIEATPQAITNFNIDSSAHFLSDLEPLEYLIDGILPRGVAYSLTGYPGHGKTTLALQFAICVSRGDSFALRETSKGSVLFLAGENPHNVKWQYAAALAAKDIHPGDADIHFVQGRFSIAEWTEVLRAKMEAMPDLKLVIIDSLQAFFEGDNDNDNAQMVEMAHKLRDLCNTSHRPALLIIAHPAGKIPSKDTLVPRGGGSFLAEIDGNLTVWSNDTTSQSLHHTQKFRGAGFDPVEFVMEPREFDHLTDIHGTPLKLPVSRPETTIERANREVKADDYLRRYLITVEAGQPLSVREMASQFRISKWRAEQVRNTAKDEKLIKRYAKKDMITDGGRAFLEGDNAGE